jgi:hypothetical protein
MQSKKTRSEKRNALQSSKGHQASSMTKQEAIREEEYYREEHK